MNLLESIEDQNEDVFALAKHVIATTGKNTNVVFSPASINIALSFIAASSSDAIREQIVSLLDASSSDELNAVASHVLSTILADNSANGSPLISAANGVWADKYLPLNPSFMELLTTSYNAVFNPVDFRTKASEVTKEVNSWIEKQTKGLITEILPPTYVPALTDVIFANALYFNGRWDDKFEASLTKEDDFHLLDGTIVRVPFMTNEEDLFLRKIYVCDGFKVLKLPYSQGSEYSRAFSMEIYLPDEKDGLSAMLESFDSDPELWNGNMSREWADICKLKVPKFQFSFEFEASEALKGLGLDLSMMKIFHKCRVEVDEEGTKAVAATVVPGCGGCGPAPRTDDFVADHPFLFVVKEKKSGLVLFLGQVLDPSITI
ncbi:unnamed protein product [Microthlaspi erraticum]|uniref:Serpin domain-containing protein n=1 Tax=Microthlaspi erraticum TaxID=1685480 RepID=A0A6D2HTR5_9BRAS|nr:unnamed protein product [Microthlaspi erraticum]